MAEQTVTTSLGRLIIVIIRFQSTGQGPFRCAPRFARKNWIQGSPDPFRMLLCWGETPYEPSDVAKFSPIKIESTEKIVDIIFQNFQTILYTIKSKISENFKEKYAWLS